MRLGSFDDRAGRRDPFVHDRIAHVKGERWRKAARNERKEHEKRTNRRRHEPSLVRSPQLKHSRAATARLLLPAAALRACNQPNRATAPTRDCSTPIGRFRHASAISAITRPTSILFGGLRGTSTACALQPQGCNYTGTPSRYFRSDFHPLRNHTNRFATVPSSKYLSP